MLLKCTGFKPTSLGVSVCTTSQELFEEEPVPPSSVSERPAGVNASSSHVKIEMFVIA